MKVEVAVLGSPSLIIPIVSVDVVPCCFTSAETIRLIKDGEPRTATSTFTQFLSSSSVLLYTQGQLLSSKDHIMDGEPRTFTRTFTVRDSGCKATLNCVNADQHDCRS